MQRPFEFTELKAYLEGELLGARKNLKLALGEGLNAQASHHKSEVTVLERVQVYVLQMEKRHDGAKELITK